MIQNLLFCIVYKHTSSETEIVYYVLQCTIILFDNVLQKSPNLCVFLDDQTILITIIYWDNHNNLIKTKYY